MQKSNSKSSSFVSISNIFHFYAKMDFDHVMRDAHGSGKWGSERYWSYYKVENNDRTVFSIEYFPVSSTARISIANNRYQGEVESVAHLQELMAAMRIPLDDSEACES